MVERKPIEGHLQDLDLLGVNGTDGTEPTPVIGKRSRHQAIGVAESSSPASCIEQASRGRWGPRSGVGRCRARWPGRVRRTGSGRSIWSRGRGPGRSSRGRRPGPGRPTPTSPACLAVVDGLGKVDGLGGAGPVAGQLGPLGLRVGRHIAPRGPRPPPVGPGPPGRSQVLVEGVLDEGVGEAESARGVRSASRTRDDRRRGIEHVENLILGGFVAPASRSRSKSRPITAATESTRRLRSPSRHHPGSDHLAETGRAGTAGVERALGRPPALGVLDRWRRSR